METEENIVKAKKWPQIVATLAGKIKQFSLETYNAPQKHESTLLHTYVLNEFLTAVRSFTTK